MTTARPSRQQDRRRRTRHYLWAMGFRTVAFPLAVWALVSGWQVVGWILAGAAVVLPSIAVMIANAVDVRTSTQGVHGPGSRLPARRDPARDDRDQRGPGHDDPGPSPR